jgi:hypothetical protein
MQSSGRSSKAAARRIHAVAAAQAGFFTAKQAQKIGFSASSQSYHVREGHWLRESRGIYRLAEFPATLRPELARWHLWAMNRAGRAQGVYSHDTALGLYLFPVVQPLVMHMTVPAKFRRFGPTPECLALHYCELPKSDIAVEQGYRLTTPLRTVADLAAAGMMPRGALSKALLEMLKRRLITRRQIRAAEIPEVSRRVLVEMLG